MSTNIVHSKYRFTYFLLAHSVMLSVTFIIQLLLTIMLLLLLLLLLLVFILVANSLSKLLAYSVLRSTQSPTLSGTGNE